MVLHLQDSLKSNGLLLVIDNLISIGKHGDEEVQKHDKVHQDKQHEVDLASIFLEETEVLFAGESTEQLNEKTPSVQIIIREILGIKDTDHEDAYEWKTECN